MGLIRSRWGSLRFLVAIAFPLGGCSSSGISTNPTPVITSIFPQSITAGSAMFNIDITGQGFLNQPASVALWNGSPRKTTFNVSTGHLSITILAADVTNPSVGLITVANPAPGGGTSNGVSFIINPLQNGAPTNISLDPSSANAGTLGPFKLTVNGLNFVAGSIIRWNGTFRQPTTVSPTALTTDLTTMDLATAGFASVSVDNPLPGGIVASSVSVDFLINSPKGANAAAPQVISVNASGGPADGASAAPAISADGRFVAFYSTAKNLVREGASGNIFVRDTCLGATNCTPHTVAVDLAADGSAPNSHSGGQLAMSADGRFVAFASDATNLVPSSQWGANPGDYANIRYRKFSLFLRDMCAGANVPAGCTPHTELLARDVNGPRYYWFPPSLSADGRYAVFVSEAPGGVSGNSANQSLVYVRDTCAGPTATVACVPKTIPVMSVGTAPAGDGQAYQPKNSSTGRYLALQIRTPVGTKTDGLAPSQVYLWDSCLGMDAPAACVPSTLRISVAADGTALEGLNSVGSISTDARFVVFESQSLGKGDGEIIAPVNIFLRDTCLGPTASDGCIPSTTLIHSEEMHLVGALNNFLPSIDPSGRVISFVTSGAGPGLEEIGVGTVLIHDTCFGATLGCTPGTRPLAVPGGDLNSNLLIVDRITPVPLTAGGRYAVFYSRAAADPAAPVSCQGDVFLTATPFK